MNGGAARRQELGAGATIAERYVVRGALGEGGMGQVLRVEHVALGRPFALKVLRLEKWNDELVRRFNREARALARLTTPRVAQVTDFGVDPEAGPFYVMELVEGETLEQRIEREGRLPVQEALAICAEVCDGLADVHAAGIVHRDLKPSNVALPIGGPVRAKLLDFGLAAAMDDGFLSKITQSQQILGSLPYMAPEQFNAADPAPTMDVYALGVVLHEAVTGQLPFQAPSTAALIHQILATPCPPLPHALAGRHLLEPLLERLLGKEPEQRFASAAAAGQALREVAASIGARSVHPPTRASNSGVPKTSEGPADVGLMPTLQSSPVHTTAPIAESGTRLQAQHVGDAPAPSRWPVHVIVLGLLGVLLAAIAGVAAVVALSLALPDDPVVAPEEITPEEITPAEPAPVVAAPAIEAPAAGQSTDDQSADDQSADDQSADDQSADDGAGQSAAGPSAATEPQRTERPAPPARERPAPEPRARTATEEARPRRRVEPPPSEPAPVAPVFAPSTQNPGRSPSGGGIIRQW